MVLTRSEKEELVKQLYEEGKTIREIAKEVHMSFGSIGNIIRKVTGDSSIDKPTISNETEALKLFQEGKEPVEAAIILGISPDDTEDLYLGYLRLKNQHQLVMIHQELKCQLPAFVRFFNVLREAGIKVEQAPDLIKEAKQIPIIQKTFWDLTNANTNLEGQLKATMSELSSIRNEVNRQEGYLQWYLEEQKRLNFEIEQKKSELQYWDGLANDRLKDYVRYK